MKASLMDVAQWLDVWCRCCPFYELFAAAGGEAAEVPQFPN
jgi:hypothetical protein